ncbi:hypothetical protein EEL33_15560 [Muribaculaceae bacterium Isolate-037 (Harlan)]|nr:hypothetical protein EEL33_15560 [Muribaculaceae bacterium Isolate-037 (Harlan)]
MSKYIFSLLLCMSFFATHAANSYLLKSPDGHISVEINTGKNIGYTIINGENRLLDGGAISMTLDDGTVLGSNPRVAKVMRKSVCDTITPLVRFKTAKD